MSDYYNKFNKKELKRNIKSIRGRIATKGGSTVQMEKQLGKMEDNYSKRFGAIDFRKGGMVVSTVDNKK
jgi:hypothetical protein